MDLKVTQLDLDYKIRALGVVSWHSYRFPADLIPAVLLVETTPHLLIHDFVVLFLLLSILNETSTIKILIRVCKNVVSGVDEKAFSLLWQVDFTWVFTKDEPVLILFVECGSRSVLPTSMLSLLVAFHRSLLLILIVIIILVTPRVLLPAMKPLNLNYVIC